MNCNLTKNVGDTERTLSVIGGVIALGGLSRVSIYGLLMAGFGAALIYRGVTGHCSMYESLGVDTAAPESTLRMAHSR